MNIFGKKIDENGKQQESDAMDYVVLGADSGNDVLDKVKKIRANEEEEVIYGVYDNSDKGILTKINNFFIDHSRISLKDKSYFFHMLAVMVDAGIPVVKAVKSLASRSDNAHFKRILNTVAYYCEHGSELHTAMTRFENVFNEAEVGIIKSGEATGKLGKMLFRLSEELDKKHDLSLKLWGAAVYPIVVICVLILVAVGMLVFVFPTLLSLLKEGGISSESLPFATKVLMIIENVLVNYWYVILIALGVLYAIFHVYIISDYGAVRWDYFKLKFPVAGNLLRKIFVLRFVSLLGLLIESGLGVIPALKIAGTSLSNRVYKLKVQEVINLVREGGKISESLKDAEFLFPLEISQMLYVGESSASLGIVSQKIAEQYQREIDNSLKKISSVFEPLMIVIVGVFVALLALSIMAPIFNLSGSVGT